MWRRLPPKALTEAIAELSMGGFAEGRGFSEANDALLGHGNPAGKASVMSSTDLRL